MGFLEISSVHQQVLNITRVKKNIKQEMTTIDGNIHRRIIDSMHKLIADCTENKNGNLGNVIFKN